MTECCPSCGFDLTPFAPIARGDLFIPDRLTVSWQGRRIKLTPQQRLIVLALVKANGETVRRHALGEASGADTDDKLDPSNVVDVQICRIRHAFAAVDPMFDQIETVWGEGVRWRQ